LAYINVPVSVAAAVLGEASALEWLSVWEWVLE
jgi:hypothetical protein